MDTPTPAPAPAATPTPPRRGWWSRNWKWFVPTGCLTLLGLGAAFILALVVFVFGLLRSTDVYKTAVTRAKINPAVIEALGTPMHEGWLIQGQTNAQGTTGEANMSIPISGPKGQATIYLVATKTAGDWKYSTLEVEVAGQPERIDLLPDSEPEP